MKSASPPDAYSFARYLAAKKSVDDRALNRYVWQALAAELAHRPSTTPLQVLEVGAGIGTMIERALDWDLLTNAEYWALDAEEENIAITGQRLSEWGARCGFRVERSTPDCLDIYKGAQRLKIQLQTGDLFDFIRRQAGQRQWHLLIAHAFLDLMDIPTTLPLLFSLSHPGGLFYFGINFDGMTLFEPTIDPQMDKLIQSLYHRTMDERKINERLSGDSRAGRHLFTHLRAAGAEIIAAGASDWVVHPVAGSYPHDEAYFLHFILHTIEGALVGNPAIDPVQFAAWVAERHAQVQRGELIYIAHQLDFVGRILFN